MQTAGQTAGQMAVALGQQIAPKNPGHLEQLAKQLESLKALREKLVMFSAKVNGAPLQGNDAAREPSPCGIYALIGEIKDNIQVCHNVIDELYSSF